MFWKKPMDSTQRELEIALGLAVRDLANHQIGSQAYEKTLGYVMKLQGVRDKNLQSHDSVSKNTWAVIGGNLLGILMIVRHEFANPINSKALNFILKSPRII